MSDSHLHSDEPIFSTIPEALADIRAGKLVIVMDDEDRENEGDLIGAAEFTTAEQIAFMLKHTTGYFCAPMTAQRATELGLSLMVKNSSDPNKTAYTETVDEIGCSTGVSGGDRSLTFRSLADSSKKASSFRRPGHTCPLIAKPGGVLERQGHTEASVDLCKLAGVQPVAIICELVNDDAVCSMMRLPQAVVFARKYNLKLITIEQMIKYRLETEPGSKMIELIDTRGVELIASCKLPVKFSDQDLGEFDLHCFYSHFDGLYHQVLSRGVLSGSEPVPVRVHSECFTGDILGSQRCDCGEQLRRSLAMIANAGRGAVFYNVGQEGRGIGIANKIKAYKLQQEQGMNTYEANHALGFKDDLRNYNTAINVIKSLGISKIVLITSNNTKAEAFGDLVEAIVPLQGTVNSHNHGYLNAKAEHLGEPGRCSTPGHVIPVLSTLNGVENVKSSPVVIPAPVRPTLKVGVVSTTWNEALVKPFTQRVVDLLHSSGTGVIELVRVPGSLETPIAAQRLIKDKKCDVVIAIGLLLKGETTHFEEVSRSTFAGLMQVQLKTGKPVISGIFTCLTEEQAHARLGPGSDLVRSYVASALTMAQ